MSCSDCQINKGLAWQYHQQLQEARREIAVLREQLGISPKEPMYVIEEKPRPFRGVYFIESGGFIKIGISKDVRMRLKNLQLQTLPARLGFIPIESDEAAFNRERELHKRFELLRHHGEWFRDCEEIRTFIAANAMGWPA